jgi:predicted nucleotidyltransferase
MKINVLSQHSGLSVAIIERIITVLSAHPNLEQAILYGSRAKGNYREGSDIDLTLTGIALNDTELGRIDNELDELLLPYTFDLSLLQQIDNPDLIDHIKRVGIVFYQRS